MLETRTTSNWAALPVLLAGAFMVVLDFFIVNVALPSMAADLGAGPSALEWVVAGYGLSFAAFLITAGRLGDEHGRARVYALGLGFFTVTSAACGIAPSPATLVLARIAQGVAGAVVIDAAGRLDHPRHLPGQRLHARARLLRHRARRRRGRRAGDRRRADRARPRLARLLLDQRADRPRRRRSHAAARAGVRAPERGRLGVGSAAVLALGLVAVLLPLIEGRRHGWPAWTSISLAAAPAILGAFLAQQSRLARRGETPLLDLGLFRRRTFSAGLLTQLCLASAQASFFAYLALYLQDGRGLGPFEAGLVFTILAVAYVALSGPAPALTARFGRSVVVAGGVTLTAGLAVLAVAVAENGVAGSVLALVPGLVLVGAGIGLCFTPLTAIVLAGVDPARAGAASGAMSTTMQVGYALGVAVTGVIFFAHADIGHAFELSLIQLGATAAGIVAAALLLPAAQTTRSRRRATAPVVPMETR